MYAKYYLGDDRSSLAPAHPDDAALDIICDETAIVEPGTPTVIRTGLWLALPPGWVGLVCSRSGLASQGIFVVNAPGVIDAGYRGEVKVILGSLGPTFIAAKGDRIAQLIITKLPTMPLFRLTADEFSQGCGGTSRGTDGLGSTGLHIIEGGDAA